MLSLPSSVRIFVSTEPTDMRKSFDGLVGLVETVIRQSPTSGHLFLFINRNRDRLKILYWDRDGMAIFYKRLEQGTTKRTGIFLTFVRFSRSGKVTAGYVASNTLERHQNQGESCPECR